VTIWQYKLGEIMSTTVEISRDALFRLKKIRDIINEEHKVHIRMIDLMEHITLRNPEDMANMVIESINNINNKKS